jgi:hypothetical protein
VGPDEQLFWVCITVFACLTAGLITWGILIALEFLLY